MMELPVRLTIELEAKIRFLLHSYLKIHNRESPISNINLMDAAVIVDSIANELS